ncbi:hypothetical protein CPT76_33710 [Paenibacillus sp. AR247]|nr:hypothetical protein CPT76_33710 [Paenibacillus sp. AR247]
MRSKTDRMTGQQIPVEAKSRAGLGEVSPALRLAIVSNIFHVLLRVDTSSIYDPHGPVLKQQKPLETAVSSSMIVRNSTACNRGENVK